MDKCLDSRSFDNMPSGYLVTDSERSICFINSYALSHLERDDLCGKPLFEVFTRASCILFESYVAPMLLKEGACDEIQLSLKTAAGDKRPVVLNARCDSEDSEIVHWSFISASQRDKLYQELVDARNLLEEKNRILAAKSATDDVTGLPNRASITRYLAERIKRASVDQSQFVVIFVDLDGFKAINDTYGHAVGDQFLKAAGQRLVGSLRATDMVARYGGDEYVILLEHTTEEAKTSDKMIQRIIRQVKAPFQINGFTLSVSASAGATHYPQRWPIEPDQLIRQADKAMYEAKLAGKNQVCWFDPEREANQKTYHELIAQIRLGVKLNQFVLHYQPKVDLETGVVSGVEALIRWQHPDSGLLMPNEFLPYIENKRVEHELGDWVIGSALQQANDWRETGLVLPVSVNVSSFQLMDELFLERLAATLRMYPDLPSSHLELELLETSVIEDSANIAIVISACQRLGLRIALDDFGTGYSTLSHLRHLSVDVLKIDRSYVQDMLTNASDLAIIKGIIGFAEAFNCQIIAEGIETPEQQAALLDLGCNTGQGYHISRPMPAEAIGSWMTGRF